MSTSLRRSPRREFVVAVELPSSSRLTLTTESQDQTETQDQDYHQLEQDQSEGQNQNQSENQIDNRNKSQGRATIHACKKKAVPVADPTDVMSLVDNTDLELEESAASVMPTRGNEPQVNDLVLAAGQSVLHEQTLFDAKALLTKMVNNGKFPRRRIR